MGKFARKNQKELRLEAKKKSRAPKKASTGENVLNNEGDLVDPDAEDFVYDDVDRYHQQKQKDSLARGFQFEEEDESDREEEVLPVGDDGTSEDESEEDIPADEDEGLPNRSAWGTKRSAYYQTDFVDKDHGRFVGSDAEEAEEEEREARELRAKMTAELAEDDFGLSSLVPLEAKQTEESLDVVTVAETAVLDISKLSDLEKMERLKQESPELLDLIADGKRKLQELAETLNPLFGAVVNAKSKILTDRAERYIKTKYHLVLGYCQNVAFYLSLKAKRIPVDNHPVTRRLVDFRKLLLKLESLDKLYAADMKLAVETLKSGKKLDTLRRKPEATKAPSAKKRVKFADDVAPKSFSEKEPSLSQKLLGKRAADKKEEEMDVDEEAPQTGDAKRAVTYQIAKNKGVVPYRKKEYRNPRVKHRMKYRKALISRKGQVKEHRPEMQKYGGEVSGIRAGVIKSRKFK